MILEKFRLDKARRKSAVCKIVQKGDLSGYVDYKSVHMLSSKNNDTIVLDVKTVTHNSQKRKLVLLARSSRPQNLIRSYCYLDMLRLVSKNRYLVSKTVTFSYSCSTISAL